MRVLVTGAAGRLGTAVCDALLAAGFELRATDKRYSAEVKVKLQLADLLEERAVYGLVEDCDAVVHLANHPNLYVPVSRQQLLADNVAMDANIFQATADLGLRRLVFSSSVQTTFARENELDERDLPAVPYLPVDGCLPANPGRNMYGLSKEFGEKLLRFYAARDPELCATALRFPMLIPTGWYERLREDAKGIRRRELPVTECFTYLPMRDAAALVVRTLTHGKPGYHQYFPAQCMRPAGTDWPALIQTHYPGAELRRPVHEIESLVDLSALWRDLGWRPTDAPLTLTVES